LVFQSDRALSRDDRAGPAFKAFVGQQVYVLRKQTASK
jgi:hypothetical protein